VNGGTRTVGGEWCGCSSVLEGQRARAAGETRLDYAYTGLDQIRLASGASAKEPGMTPLLPLESPLLSCPPAKSTLDCPSPLDCPPAWYVAFPHSPSPSYPLPTPPVHPSPLSMLRPLQDPSALAAS
jgi:hypothetical protein